MPPSGFNPNVVRDLVESIGSCFDDLSEEVAKGKYSSHKEAVETEPQQIRHAIQVDGNKSSGPLIGALKFVESCYAELSKKEILDQSAYRNAATALLDKLEEDLTACHIENGILVSRE